MKVLYRGGCQCGRIRYELHAEPLTLYACHCTDCQRQSASGFGMSMPVPREALVLVAGQPKEWRKVGDSGREVICQFCADCGTRLFHSPTRNPRIVNIKPGSLDDTSWLQPVAHLWTRSKQPWVQIDGECLFYDGQPDDFEPVFERWRTRNQPRPSREQR